MVAPRRPIPSTARTVRVRPRATLRPLVFAVLCATGFCASGAVSARDSGSRNVGDWAVAPSKDGKGCFLMRQYDRAGGTTLLLGLDIDGTNRLSVLNANWSIKPREPLKLTFRLSDSSYPAHFAVGIVSDGQQGFVTSFGAKFPSYFAASKLLQISRGDVPVERLSLDQGAAAIAALRQCVDNQRSRPAATPGGKAHSDDIPSDPFAPAPARRPKK